jgi:hypothetical protein
VAALLFFETLLQRLHQLFPATQRFDEFLFFLSQRFFGELFKPLLRDVFGQHGIERLHALEVVREGAVEAVEVGFVLHQRGAGEVVEIVHAAVDDAFVERFYKGEVFLDRDGEAALF